jgi:hypothetical protein
MMTKEESLYPFLFAYCRLDFKLPILRPVNAKVIQAPARYGKIVAIDYGRQ